MYVADLPFFNLAIGQLGSNLTKCPFLIRVTDWS